MKDNLLREYVDIKEIKSEIINENDIYVEHRDNNSKRDFIFVNRIQGKHIATSPNLSLSLFKELGSLVNAKIRDKSAEVIVIGFAETATAISNCLGDSLCKVKHVMQTTREKVDNHGYLVSFSEEHSHATFQGLYGKRKWFYNKKFLDTYVLFVEDEITTGKTILNFINELKEINSSLKYGVASICNWQNKENTNLFKKMNIDTFYLVKGELKDEHKKMNVVVKDYCKEQVCSKYSIIDTTDMNEKYSSFKVERLGRNVSNGKNKVVNDIATEELRKINEASGGIENILVIGTEEFMYIPMSIGKLIENLNANKGISVKFQATTRSSIDITDKSNIVNKSKIVSAYDNTRDTYLYNLAKYDRVIIITDSECVTDEFKNSIVSALENNGTLNGNIGMYTV